MAPAGVTAGVTAGRAAARAADRGTPHASDKPGLDVPPFGASESKSESGFKSGSEFDGPVLAATEPAEARGLRRDEVRLLVSDVARDSLHHARFRDLPHLLSEVDLLVVNASGTLNAALPADIDGTGLAAAGTFFLHLSTHLGNDVWVVELRQPGPVASLPFRDAYAGLTLRLPADARATLLAPHPPSAVPSSRSAASSPSALSSPAVAPASHSSSSSSSSSRLWRAELRLPADTPLSAGSRSHSRSHARYLPGAMRRYLDRHGLPIRYSYVPAPWPPAMYQTIFATEPGSAEMPSAARPFTPDLVTRLIARGIQIAPLVLHTGVASLEDHEPPYAEYYRVSPETAARVNAARRAGHRIAAVGTTVVRALETVTDAHGVTHAGEGWTDLVITPDRPLRAVDALVTGLHEPRATHLAILERVIDSRVIDGRAPSHAVSSHLARAYAEARRGGYLWHEFGDAHLILGPRR